MKIMRIVVLLLLLPLLAVAKDTVFVKGYCIYQYEKKDLMLQKKEHLISQRNNNSQYDYIIQWRYDPVPFYFPIQLNDTVQLMKEKNMAIYVRAFPGYDQGFTAFEFPQFSNYINSYLRDTLNISFDDKNNKFDPLYNDYTYYKIPEDSLHVYQIRYIEGHALRRIVSSAGIGNPHFFEFANAIRLINVNIPFFYIYLFYDYALVYPPQIPEGFVKWSPSQEELLQLAKGKPFY